MNKQAKRIFNRVDQHVQSIDVQRIEQHTQT